MKRPLISLCIPTNGVIEWVVPVIESIYSQNVDNYMFEVIVTDNGDNKEFKKKMDKIKYPNFHYHKNNSKSFLNEIECYKLANGLFTKLVNHREYLLPGTLSKYINIVEKNKEERPAIFFTNGALDNLAEYNEYDNFNDFVNGISYLSSCSDGNAFWTDDFKKTINKIKINELFPHTSILFSQTNKRKYIISNSKLFDEIKNASPKKGKYDLFYAFSIEYLNIINNLLVNNYITVDTFNNIKEGNLNFILWCYIDYCVFNEPCSYALVNFNKYMNVFYGSEYKQKLMTLCLKKYLTNFYKSIYEFINK